MMLRAREHKLPDHHNTVETQARWLYEFGHFDGTGVRGRDLKLFDGSEEEFQRAVRSIQSLDINCETLCQKKHNRALTVDGDVGPATVDLMRQPRCSCRDVMPIEVTQAAMQWRADVGLATGLATNTRRGLILGSGSWPTPGCDEDDPDRSTVHSVRIALNIQRMTLSREYLNSAIEAAEKAGWEVGLRPRYIINGSPSEAEMDIRFQRLAGSVIGWNEFPQAGTCRQTIDGRLDTGYRPGGSRGFMWFANLLVHEQFGHGVGLSHTRGGIMNPSIVLVDPVSYKPRDPSLARMTRFFGGEDVTPSIDPPPPPPPPDPEDPVGGIPWKEILDIVITLIRECGDSSRATIRDPSAAQKNAFERRIRRRLKISRNDWNDGKRDEVMPDIYAQAKRASDAEIDAVLEDANEDDEFGDFV